MNDWIIKSAVLLIAALMLLSLYLLTKPGNGLLLSEAELALRPDSIIEQMHAIEFTHDGNVSSILTTPRFTHYPINNRSDLQTPVVTIFQAEQPPWEIKADVGQTDHGTAQITLYDHVQLQQAGDANQKATTITTSKLIYHPALQLAQTDQPIELQQAGVLVRSVGLFADLEAQVIELLQNVWGRYDAH